MVSVENLTIDFSGTPLFDDISFLINAKEKVALVGKNGAGKTTLLRLFNKEISPTSGNIVFPKDITIAYLPQHLLLNDGKTVLDEVLTSFSDLISIQRHIDDITEELAERKDYDSAEYMDLIDLLAVENERLTMYDANNMMSEVERTLIGLGFKRSDFGRMTSEFSGGWRMRIELAKILLKRPNLLLLDEPTNHLDIESIQWLESFLSTCNSALLLVSHDRAFLDSVTTRTVEISLGDIHDYKVSYSRYVDLRKERREQQLRAFENQQKMIAETEQFIETFRYKATKAVQVQSRIKQLEKIKRIEIDEEDNSTLRLKFPPAPHSGVLPVNVESLTKSYGDLLVLDAIDIQIRRGDKVAFVGKNGEGKSTLVKCIMGEIDHTGLMTLGHGVKIGYFAQNQASLLDGELTVFDTIDRVAVGDIRTKIRDILGAFMFGGEASDKKVKVLSGGERSRLAMIKLLLEPVNLLILDEPTNHLDMRSKDVLKEAIKAFDGTVIVVSHDRDFLVGLVEKVYEFTNKKVVEHLGDIQYFLEKKRIDNIKEIERAKFAAKAEREEQSGASSANKISYEERKEISKKIKKLERAIEECERRIEELESSLATLEDEFSAGNSAPDMMEKYNSQKSTLDEVMMNWEKHHEELAEISAQLEN